VTKHLLKICDLKHNADLNQTLKSLTSKHQYQQQGIAKKWRPVSL
jgi:hypothetical protein